MDLVNCKFLTIMFYVTTVSNVFSNQIGFIYILCMYSIFLEKRNDINNAVVFRHFVFLELEGCSLIAFYTDLLPVWL